MRKWGDDLDDIAQERALAELEGRDPDEAERLYRRDVRRFHDYIVPLPDPEIEELVPAVAPMLVGHYQRKPRKPPKEPKPKRRIGRSPESIERRRAYTREWWRRNGRAYRIRRKQLGGGMARYRRPKVLSQRHDPSETHIRHEYNNCTMTAAAMALDYHTGGNIQKRGGNLRHSLRNPDTGSSPGVTLNLDDAKEAWRKFGENLTIAPSGEEDWEHIAQRLNEGRMVIMQGDSGDLDQSCSENQDVGHAIAVHPDRDPNQPGKRLVADPWCLTEGTNGLGKWRWISVESIKRYARKEPLSYNHAYTRRRSRIG